MKRIQRIVGITASAGIALARLVGPAFGLPACGQWQTDYTAVKQFACCTLDSGQNCNGSTYPYWYEAVQYNEHVYNGGDTYNFCYGPNYQGQCCNFISSHMKLDDFHCPANSCQ
jgi:hypothetical protein